MLLPHLIFTLFTVAACDGHGLAWDYDEGPAFIFYEATVNGVGIGYPVMERWIDVGCGHDGDVYCVRGVDAGPPPVFTDWACITWEDRSERFMEFASCPWWVRRPGSNCPDPLGCYYPDPWKLYCSGTLRVRGVMP